MLLDPSGAIHEEERTAHRAEERDIYISRGKDTHTTSGRQDDTEFQDREYNALWIK